MEEPTQLYTITFTHIYDMRGFAISGEFTADGKDYHPPSRHACLSHGYWCWSNARQYPGDIWPFIIKKLKIK